MKIVKLFFSGLSYMLSAIFALGCLGVLTRFIAAAPPVEVNVGLFVMASVIEFIIFAVLCTGLWKIAEKINQKEIEYES